MAHGIVMQFAKENNICFLNTTYDFRIVIADEGQCLKGPHSKYREHLVACAPNSLYRVLLSATPKTRAEDDYFGLCLWVDKGETFTDDIEIFRAAFMKHYTFNNHQFWKIRGEEQSQQIMDDCQHLFVEYALTEASNIPIKSVTVYGKLTEAAQHLYDTLNTTGMINLLDADKPLPRHLISAKLNTLCSGFLYTDQIERATLQDLLKAVSAKALMSDKKKKVVLKVFPDRVNLLKKLVKWIHKKHGAEQNICITYTFKHELDQLREAFPTGVDDMNQPEDDWNAGKIPYLFMQYTRSAKSLNLQGGGHIMIAYSQTFQWESRYQIVRRLARTGQKAERVYLYTLHIKRTMDDEKTERMSKRAGGHKAMQNRILRDLED